MPGDRAVARGDRSGARGPRDREAERGRQPGHGRALRRDVDPDAHPLQERRARPQDHRRAAEEPARAGARAPARLLSAQAQAMPIITIEWYEGRSAEQKKEVAE